MFFDSQQKLTDFYCIHSTLFIQYHNIMKRMGLESIIQIFVTYHFSGNCCFRELEEWGRKSNSNNHDKECCSAFILASKKSQRNHSYDHNFTNWHMQTETSKIIMAITVIKFFSRYFDVFPVDHAKTADALNIYNGFGKKILN